MSRDLARVTMSGRRCARWPRPSSEQRAPAGARSTTINRALHARQVIELVPAPDGVHRRPPPCRRPDRRRPGSPGRSVRHRADRGSPGTDQDLRQRHLRLDLLRLVTDEPPALVRHGDLRQPRQGRPPPGADEGVAGQRRDRPWRSTTGRRRRSETRPRRDARRARGSAGPRSRSGSSTPRRTATGNPRRVAVAELEERRDLLGDVLGRADRLVGPTLGVAVALEDPGLDPLGLGRASRG